RPERMQAFAKSARHADVLAGIAAARAAGFAPVKLNTVVVRGFNDDALVDLVEFARGHGAELRFIEYMDVGGATQWSRDQVVSRREILERLGRRYGPLEPLRRGADDEALAALIRAAWTGRADRGAEQRLALAERGALFPADALRAD